MVFDFFLSSVVNKDGVRLVQQLCSSVTLLLGELSCQPGSYERVALRFLSACSLAQPCSESAKVVWMRSWVHFSVVWKLCASSLTNTKASEKREVVLIPCGDFVRLQTSEKLLQLRKLFSDLDNVLSVHLQGHSMAKMWLPVGILVDDQGSVFLFKHPRTPHEI